jgi:hypothetical protein|tara:strand:+ start:133 stop:474 length:342 start_codon:yes stop_codon:yes gene_type:complete
MSVNPGTYNFTLQRRADFSLEIQFKEGDPAAVIDLTGATVLSQAWNEKRTQKYADFAVAYNNRAQGKVTLSLTDTQTTEFPDVLYYDVMIQDSSGLRQYYLEGVITVSQGYTA